MSSQLTRVFLVPVITLFCTIGFASDLPGGGQNLSFGSAGETRVFTTETAQAGDPSWFDVVGGSESVAQEPLLLADQRYNNRGHDNNKKGHDNNKKGHDNNKGGTQQQEGAPQQQERLFLSALQKR